MDKATLIPILTRYQIPLIVSFICILAASFNSSIDTSLVFNRTQIANGEIWRLITGNFLHSNWTHLLLNLGGLWIIWMIFWDVASRFWQWQFLIFPIFFNTLFLFIFQPNLSVYVGLSGALHGTIVAFGLADLMKNKWLSVGLLIGISIKLTHEMLNGGSESVAQLIDIRVAVEAHLSGAISGAIIGIFFLFLNHLNNRSKRKSASD